MCSELKEFLKQYEESFSKNGIKSYLLFAFSSYYSVFAAAFIISLSIFKFDIFGLPTWAYIVILVAEIPFFFAAFVVPILRFVLFHRINVGTSIADTKIFIFSLIFYILLGFAIPVLERFSTQIEVESVKTYIAIPWTIFGVIAGLYVLIAGWSAMSKKKTNSGIYINFCLASVLLPISAIANVAATLFVFIFGELSLEWSSTLFHYALLLSCLGVLYYIGLCVLFVIKISKNDNEK